MLRMLRLWPVEVAYSVFPSIYGVTLAQTFIYYHRFPDDVDYFVRFLYLVCDLVWSTTVIGEHSGHALMPLHLYLIPTH